MYLNVTEYLHLHLVI